MDFFINNMNNCNMCEDIFYMKMHIKSKNTYIINLKSQLTCVYILTCVFQYLLV